MMEGGRYLKAQAAALPEVSHLQKEHDKFIESFTFLMLLSVYILI